MDRRRADGEVRPVEAGGAGALDEQGDPERVLGRALARRRAAAPCRTRCRRRRRARRAERRADVRRVEAAGEEDRHLAGDRGGERRRDPRPGPAGMRAAGGVEQDPLGAGREERAGARDDVGRGRPSAPRTRSAFQAGRPAAATSSAVSSPESWTASGSSGGDDLGDPLAAGVGGDRDDRAAGGATSDRATRARATASASVELARGARDEVQPDRVGAARGPPRGRPRRR